MAAQVGGVKCVFLLAIHPLSRRIRDSASGAGREGVKPSMTSRKVATAGGGATRGPSRDTNVPRVFRLEVRTSWWVWSQDLSSRCSTGVVKVVV